MNQRGVGLVGILVMMGTSFALIMGVLEAINSTQRQSKTLSIQQDWNNLVQLVTVSLEPSELCTRYFKNKVVKIAAHYPEPSIDGLTSLQDLNSGVTLVSMGQSYGSFQITKMAVTPIRTGAPGMYEFTIEGKKTAQEHWLGSEALRNKRIIPLSFTLNADRSILSCSSLTPPQNLVCTTRTVPVTQINGVYASVPNTRELAAATSPTLWQLSCEADEVALGGGGECPTSPPSNIALSGPFTGALIQSSVAHPLYSLGAPTRWSVSCRDWGNENPVRPTSMWVRCCRIKPL